MAGIGRIEDRLKNKLEATDRNISVAFQDLKQLIGMAQQMTKLSKSIASKIKDHDSQVSNDETVLFRSHLLELGIEQQIDIGSASKTSYSSNSKYYEGLAIQISSIIRPVMEKRNRQQLTLSEVYCCFNRARGLDLVSPDDILSACKQMSNITDLQLKLVQYKSGLLVIQNLSCHSSDIVDETARLVEQLGCITALQLATRQSIPIQLARLRLEEAEDEGRLCRDESLESLKFFPNRFLIN